MPGSDEIRSGALGEEVGSAGSQQGAATPLRGWLSSAGLGHMFGLALSTINPNSGLAQVVTRGCDRQMLISPLGVPAP